MTHAEAMVEARRRWGPTGRVLYLKRWDDDLYEMGGEDDYYEVGHGEYPLQWVSKGEGWSIEKAFADADRREGR